MSRYSRVSTEELNDEESCGGAEEFQDLATDFEDVQWLEFMGLSRWSEEGRVYVRGEVQKLVELREDASNQLEKQLGHFEGKNIGFDGGKWKHFLQKWVVAVNQLDAITCIQYIELLQAGCKQRSLTKLLNSLSLEIPWREAEMKLKSSGELVSELQSEGGHFTQFQALHSSQFLTIVGHMGPEGQVVPWEFLRHLSSGKFKARMRGCGAMMDLCRDLLIGQKLVTRVTFAWTPAVQLLRQDSRVLAMLLKSLVDAGLESRCFQQPFALAVLAEAKERTSFQVLLELFGVDVAFIVLLMYLGYTVRHFQNPNAVFASALAFLAFFTMLFNFTAALGGFMFYANSWHGAVAAMTKSLTMWNMLLCTTDLYSLFIIAKFLLHLVHTHRLKMAAFDADCHPLESGAFPEVCYIFLHPNYFSILVLIRWTHFALGVLQQRRVGSHIVPVVYAVTRPASLYFMFFLCLVVLGSFHAYFVFPIAANVDSLDYLLDTFMKMFRLEVLGDFDLNELEGLNPRINASLVPFNIFKGNPGRISGTIEDGEHNRYYHQGIRGEFVILSIMVTVVAMNVYVGLLSELYNEANKRRNQIFYHYTAEVRYRHLCRIAVLERITCYRPRAQPKFGGMYWLCYRRDEVLDED